MYYDELKQTIIKKINEDLNIKIVDEIVDDVCVEIGVFPKLLLESYIDEKTIKVIDYTEYDKNGKIVYPTLNNVVGLYIYNSTNKSIITSYENGVMVLEDNNLGTQMVEYIDELTIDSPASEQCDYLYIKSLHNLNKRLAYNLVETYRRFEIGLFSYNDSTGDKTNYYMSKIKSSLDRNFLIIDENDNTTKDMAYITDPLKFDVVEDGKLDRVIYGSVLIKTY